MRWESPSHCLVGWWRDGGRSRACRRLRVLGSGGVLGGLLALAAGAGALTAQGVQGVVRDAFRHPLEEAYVALLDTTRQSVAEVVTDEEGRFHVSAPDDGSYYVSVNRLGYGSLYDGPFPLREGRTLEVRVVLHADPIPVEGVTGSAEGRVQRLAAVGFYERMDQGFGQFLEREEFERRAVTHVTDALRSLPRVTVREAFPSATGAGEVMNPQLLVQGGGLEGYCSPTLYIDGVEVHRGGSRSDPVRPDDWLAPEDVEAVEVYTSVAAVPIQYQGRAVCGILLFWTRHAGRDR